MNRPLATDRVSTASHRSFVLLLLLVFIVLASSLLLLTTGGTAQFLRTSRQEHTSILLRQMIDSGRAWVDVHDRPQPGAAPIELDATDILPPDASGRVTIFSKPETPGIVAIEAHFELHGRSHARKVAFPIGPEKP